APYPGGPEGSPRAEGAKSLPPHADPRLAAESRGVTVRMQFCAALQLRRVALPHRIPSPVRHAGRFHARHTMLFPGAGRKKTIGDRVVTPDALNRLSATEAAARLARGKLTSAPLVARCTQ